MKRLFLFSLIFIGSVCGLTANPTTEERATMAAFLEQNCVKCHGPEEQEGDLRLDDLALPPHDIQQWREVLEAVEYEDMPPKKEPRPSEADHGKFTSALKNLLRQSAEKAEIALRRMNREEYQNTVRELLGVDTDISEMLPEDSRRQGFDNVAGGLSISAVLLEKYLEAANAAFDDVIRRYAPLPASTLRAVAMEDGKNIKAVEKKNGGVIETNGAYVDFTAAWPAVSLSGCQPKEPGIYRCKVAVWPHEPGERTLTVGVFSGPLYSSIVSKFMGTFDVTGTPGKPRIIEFTVRMNAGDSLQVLPWVFPNHVTWRDKHEPRPGVGIAWAEVHGPIDQMFPSEAQRKLFGDTETISMVESGSIYMRHRRGLKTHSVESSDPAADIDRIIRDFVPKALRRPVEKELEDRFVNLALGRLKDGRSFEDSVRTGITAVLCSPQFLLLNSDPGVDDYTIASRMSYFIWSGMPDEELLKLAEEGKLRDADVRRKQTLRMLEDKRSERFVTNFTGQWLDMREIDATTPDMHLYNDFDVLLQNSLTRETEGFFRELLVNDLSVMNFVDSDFAVLNERLAAHYRIDGVKGHERMRVVKLPEDSVRGGVLTQASVLKVTANGSNTSPVLRGVWMLDRLMGRPVPPPPPGVPAVEPDIRGAISPKDQFAKHTESTSCARCHDRIDPIGFALEEFDPVGARRTRYRDILTEDEKGKTRRSPGLSVDSSGETPDGHRFSNFAEFRKWMVAQPEVITHAVAQKLMIYGCGRRVGVMDDEAVKAVVQASGKANFGLRTMVQEVVASDFFLKP